MLSPLPSPSPSPVLIVVHQAGHHRPQGRVGLLQQEDSQRGFHCKDKHFLGIKGENIHQLQHKSGSSLWCLQIVVSSEALRKWNTPVWNVDLIFVSYYRRMECPCDPSVNFANFQIFNTCANFQRHILAHRGGSCSQGRENQGPWGSFFERWGRSMRMGS